MTKDFWEWHAVKDSLEAEENKADFHEREVWLVSFGANLGHEEGGKSEKFLRPAIIIKKFNRDRFWGIPLTHTIKSYVHYYPIEINGQKGSALLHQLRSLDRKRLFQRIGTVSESDFIQLKRKIVTLLAVEKQSPSPGGDLQLTSRPSEAEASVDSV